MNEKTPLDTQPQHSEHLAHSSNIIRIIHIIAVIVSLYIAGLSWIMISPLEGSPDDDYHLASTWCPRPLEKSGCPVREVNGKIEVQVPAEVAQSSLCYRQQTKKSASCTFGLDKKGPAWMNRVDNGDYPLGFYRVQHLFVGQNVQHSALVMRWFNWTLGFGLITAVALLSKYRVRVAMVSAALVTWVPLSLFLVASNNPSSWAISGAFIYATGLLSAIQASGKRRYALGLLATLGAVMCLLSRADAAFFVFVITLAVWVYSGFSRERLWLCITSLLLSVWGLIVFLTSGQNGALLNPHVYRENVSFIEALIRNITHLPDFLLGMFGLWERSLGWLDTPMPINVHIGVIGLLGLTIVQGLTAFNWRKFFSTGILFSVICGIPLLIMALQRIPHFNYQSRYMLPLVTVLFFFWLLPIDKPKQQLPSITIYQWCILIGLAVMTYFFAIRRVFFRFQRGLDSEHHPRMDTHAWWWQDSIFSAKFVMLVGTVAVICGYILLARLYTATYITTTQIKEQVHA